MDPTLLFRVLVVARGFEPAFVAKVDPLKGPLQAELKGRSTDGIPPENILRGRVVNSAGQAMPEAVVSVEEVQRGNLFMGNPPAGTDPLAVTDEQGDFALYSQQSFDSLSLKVEARAMAPARFNQLTGGGAPHVLTVTPGGILKGRVLLDGQPIKDLAVGAVSVDRTVENFSGDYQFATQADGRFTFLNLPPDRDYYFYGMVSSFQKFGALPARKVHVGPDGSVADAGDLAITPGRRLAGRIKLSDGKPIPGHTRLVVGRREAWDSCVAELPADGHFDIANLPPESLSVGARIPGYHISGRNAGLDRLNPFSIVGRLDQDKTNLVALFEPGPDLPSEFESLPESERPENLPIAGIEAGGRKAAWTIRGQIIDAQTGAGIPNAQVTPGRAQNRFAPDSIEWMPSGSARADAGGRFQIDLLSTGDSIKIRGDADGYLPQLCAPIAFSGAAGEVKLSLQRGEGPRGQILSASGKPLEGVTVLYLGPQEQGSCDPQGNLHFFNRGGQPGQSVTDGDGRFKFPPKIGDACEIFAANSDGFLRIQAAELRESAACRLQPWGCVRGRLVQNGKPAAGEHVDLGWPRFSPSRPYLNLYGAVTDREGRFTIAHAPPGRLALNGRHPLNQHSWMNILLKEFQLAPGRTLDLGEVEKKEAPSPALAPRFF